METFSIVAGCFAIVAAVAQVTQLVLQIRSTNQVTTAATGSLVSATAMVTYYPKPSPTLKGSGPQSSSHNREDGTDNTWPLLVGFAVLIIVVVTLYLRYRVWVLSTVAVILLLCLSVTVYTIAKIRRHNVVGGGFLGGWNLIFLNFACGFALLLYFTLRSTPYGSYDSVAKMVAESGTGVLFEGPSMLFFIAFEVVALIYILAVIVSLTLRQLGTLSLILAVLQQSTPKGFARFGPDSKVGLWLYPLAMLVLLGIAAVFSSPWFDHYIATKSFPFPR